MQLLGDGDEALMVLGRLSSLGAFVVLATAAAAAYRSDGRGVAVALPAGMIALVVTPVVVGDQPPSVNTAGNAALMVAVVLAAVSAREQRWRAAELEARTDELERLRASETREAITQERLRIAREVHDAVGHALAAITVQARVATRRLSRDPLPWPAPSPTSGSALTGIGLLLIAVQAYYLAAVWPDER